MKLLSKFQRIRWSPLLAIIIAGESIFFLPFVLVRVLRPTVLDVLGLTNYQLGNAFALYGLVAMLVYLPGGPLADIVSPRKLLTFSMILTASGGLALATIPSLSVLKGLYIFWGITTILLPWAALIKTTRALGQTSAQGFAFGLLDSGRGLIAAISATLLALYYQASVADSLTLAARTDALKKVVTALTAALFCLSAIAWRLLPGTLPTVSVMPKFNFAHALQLARLPALWLQAVVMIGAYVGFKATDDFSLYAHEVLHYSEIKSAQVAAFAFWLRPIAALGAGLLADRIGIMKPLLSSFILLIFGNFLLSAAALNQSYANLFGFAIIAGSTAIFALRGLYFALMQTTHIPLHVTGTAVGMVSVIGYLPDVFMGPVLGYCLDHYPGALGHHYFFSIVTGFAILGLMAGCLLAMTTSKEETT